MNEPQIPDNIILKIRKSYSVDDESALDLSKKYSITPQRVLSIIKGTSYRHVPNYFSVGPKKNEYDHLMFEDVPAIRSHLIRLGLKFKIIFKEGTREPEEVRVGNGQIFTYNKNLKKWL